MKTKELYLIIVFTGSFIVQIFEKYFFKDWEFLWFLFVMIIIDTITGVAKHWKLKTISSQGFSAFFLKVIIYSAALIITHVLMSFKIDGKINLFFGWFDDFIYSAIMAREAISIFENFAIINPDLFPAWILKRLKAFDSSGKLPDLTGE